MKLLLGTILLVASFGAMAGECSVSSPGDCDQAKCEGLKSSGKPVSWSGGKCLVSQAEKSNSDCDQINGSTGEKSSQPSGDAKKDGASSVQK